MLDKNWWPTDYFASRNQFIQTASACGAQMQSIAVEPVGPKGEALSVDIASFVSDDDDHRIILTSGVHGAEGFIGACIQIQALQLFVQRRIAKRIGIVMIHAVNPYGFAHLRRVDENNIDVNRNFIDFNNSKPASHKNYASLDSTINPKFAPGTLSEIKYWLSAGTLIARNRGIKELVKPIAEGQYLYPKGLFYGGAALSASASILQKLVQDVAKDVERITILDLHSGLGPGGTATLISNSNIVFAENQLEWLQTHYQQPVIFDDASDNAYRASGTLGAWCQQALKHKHYLYLCVEIGTVRPLKLFSALRRENQAHHWTDVDTAIYSQTKQELLDVFAPRSVYWRNKAISEGLHAFERTLSIATPGDPSMISV
ncbi:MAG: M14 family metallopeptidase [Granulosicoccus sp.]